MRSDMERVLIQRPRGHARWKRPKERLGREPELWPTKQSMSRDRYGTKFLEDLLGPLRRFLRSRVGHHWDDVYSEITSTLRGRGTMQRHLLEHLADLVHQDVTVIGGRAYSQRSWGGAPVELSSRHLEFYVHPKSGRLCSTIGPQGHWAVSS